MGLYSYLKKKRQEGKAERARRKEHEQKLKSEFQKAKETAEIKGARLAGTKKGLQTGARVGESRWTSLIKGLEGASKGFEAGADMASSMIGGRFLEPSPTEKPRKRRKTTKRKTRKKKKKQNRSPSFLDLL